ncbi:DUF1643 domain-containing protein [Cohnella ginsengisoli]|uniref:DUF1643 domain-containing protein n=1 Tax=Cohnella ginsengisoli TaxID=425004 RepID=A0A9X4KE81_9BACL|nr:DUF1643 domain-containing protein [Cohnella ginsengisoli]MDG0789969.1 DUF1643 domain-containing protein [Cohnella ginsengisoli]
MGIYDQFECYGHFYQIVKEGKVIACCRSQLDIVDTQRLTNASSIDALAIMMNPGTSKPCDENYIEPQVDIMSFRLHGAKPLVSTIPDDTQKRLMKIMKYKQWTHMRVINLSDIRQPKSAKLPGELRKYKTHSSNHEHSIFSDERKDELAAILELYEDKPIIVAWGSQPCLSQYAKACLKALENRDYYGVSTSKVPYFHHPLTRQFSWINSLIALMDKTVSAL